MLPNIPRRAWLDTRMIGLATAPGKHHRAAALALGCLVTVAACVTACTSGLASRTQERPPTTAAASPITPTAATLPASDSTTAPAPTPPSTTPSTPAAAGTALAGLAAITVKGRAPMTGYARSRFGQAWTDDNDEAFGRNGCDTRNDVLRRDLHETVVKAGTFGCVALSGRLDDPYTATAIAFVRGASTSSKVQIDHVVALGNAWQSGAQQWTDRQRQNLANDPLNLLAVDGSANEQKGDANAASWLPANHAFRCTYVARQVAVKLKWHLFVTAAERDAIARVLAGCPMEPLPIEPGALGPTTVRVSSTAPAGPGRTSAPAPPGSAAPYYGSCAAVRAAGKAPLLRGQPGYRSALDRDGDGVACE